MMFPLVVYCMHHESKMSFTHRKIPVAENGDDACHPTNQYGPPRLNDHISHRSNGNTPGQGRVLYVNLRTPHQSMSASPLDDKLKHTCTLKKLYNVVSRWSMVHGTDWQRRSICNRGVNMVSNLRVVGPGLKTGRGGRGS